MKEDLIDQPQLKEAVSLLVALCKEKGNHIALAILDKERERCFVSVSSNSDDISYMAAEQLFDFCKQTSEENNMPINSIVKVVFNDFVENFNKMIEKNNKEIDLLSNPKGEA